MFIIVRGYEENCSLVTDFFGPFPTEERAREYAKSFDNNTLTFSIENLIVPNCVLVTLKY